jgi:hypothetical protein
MERDCLLLGLLIVFLGYCYDIIFFGSKQTHLRKEETAKNNIFA